MKLMKAVLLFSMIGAAGAANAVADCKAVSDKNNAHQQVDAAQSNKEERTVFQGEKDAPQAPKNGSDSTVQKEG